jgi:lactoylglutathione lyase
MRIAHTMIRVTDLDVSVGFYRDCLGMQELRRTDYPEGRFTLVFMGYGAKDDTATIELTYNYDTHRYDLGNAFGHIAIEVADAYKVCAEVLQKGGQVPRPAGPMQHGTTVIAFIKDPDGYMIELVQKPRTQV